jgi:hypothetical protein
VGKAHARVGSINVCTSVRFIKTDVAMDKMKLTCSSLLLQAGSSLLDGTS